MNTPTELTDPDIERAVSFLMANEGKKISPQKDATDKFSTAGVWAAYWAIAHTDLRPDIKALANFNAVAGYSNNTDVLDSEYGSTDEVRWTLSTNASKSSAATPIYASPIVAANAYGIVEIDSMSAELVFKPLGAGEDPLNQRMSMGWKGYFGAGILDDGWVCLLRSTKA